jgi:hypothetical protein
VELVVFIDPLERLREVIRLFDQEAASVPGETSQAGP